jgi:hypothetical protein
MLIAGDRGFRIQRITGARKKKVGNQIGAALRPVLLDRRSYDLSPFDRATGFVIVPQPAIEKVPGEFLTDLRVVGIELWKRLPGNVIQQFTVGAEADFAGIFLGSLDVFLERPVGLWLFDLKGVAGLDATQQILAHHALNLLPVLRPDGLSHLEIRIRCGRN